MSQVNPQIKKGQIYFENTGDRITVNIFKLFIKGADQLENRIKKSDYFSETSLIN
jgi:hypothetical protein